MRCVRSFQKVRLGRPRCLGIDTAGAREKASSVLSRRSSPIDPWRLFGAYSEPILLPHHLEAPFISLWTECAASMCFWTLALHLARDAQRDDPLRTYGARWQ